MSCFKGRHECCLDNILIIFYLYSFWFFFSHEREIPLPRSFKQIRPRAEELCTAEDLKVGGIVFVNHNMENPKERGLWSVSSLNF